MALSKHSRSIDLPSLLCEYEYSRACQCPVITDMSNNRSDTIYVKKGTKETHTIDTAMSNSSNIEQKAEQRGK